MARPSLTFRTLCTPRGSITSVVGPVASGGSFPRAKTGQLHERSSPTQRSPHSRTKRAELTVTSKCGTESPRCNTGPPVTSTRPVLSLALRARVPRLTLFESYAVGRPIIWIRRGYLRRITPSAEPRARNTGPTENDCFGGAAERQPCKAGATVRPDDNELGWCGTCVINNRLCRLSRCSVLLAASCGKRILTVSSPGTI